MGEFFGSARGSRPVAWRRHSVLAGAAVFIVALLVACGAAVEEAADSSAGTGSAEEAQTARPTAGSSAEEEAAGWRALFDGETLDGWKGFGLDGLPAGWEVVDGTIHFVVVGGERADLMTLDQFESFDLKLEWAVSEGANSGIFFHVSEDHDHAYETAPEYQILHNAGHRDGENAVTSAGSNYALHAPTVDVTRPVGEFNEARLRVDGDRVTHWLNGEKLLEYTLWDDDWEAAVAASKFASMPDYGLNRSGYIALQDHGDEIWFRNIRILPLP